MEQPSRTARAEGIPGKLVRDRIPEIVRAQGGRPVSVTLNRAAYASALRHKLLEEAEEAATAGDDTLLDELADVYELVVTIARLAGITDEDIVRHADEKRAARGGFDRRIWLSASDATPDDERTDWTGQPPSA
jgi:predicted house-cleaning noncanonical NTP pyrophosphatase (MazG superfamily)